MSEDYVYAGSLKEGEYIPLENLKHGYVYRIASRNLSYGVWDEQAKGFLGIRKKFEDEFLFMEYEWSVSETFGTARALNEEFAIDTGIPVKASLRIYNPVNGRDMVFTTPVSKGGQGWIYKDDGSKFIAGIDDGGPVSEPNQVLFDLLKTIV